ncbi:MAG TPA: Hpt domain-containing protein [Rhizobiaceae bacterium]|nr:Hpt domain-containing protein [Rhizobiaceae bacterium]
MQMRLKADIGKARREGGKPVDLVHLSAQTMGDRALEAEVLRIFLSQAPVWMDALTRTGGNTARREAAHTLKGSARAIGAFRLADLAAEAEMPASSDTGELQAEFDRVMTYVRTLI